MRRALLVLLVLLGSLAPVASLASLGSLAACSGKSGDKASGDKASGDKASGDKASGDKASDPWAAHATVPPPKPPEQLVVDQAGAEPRRVIAFGLGPTERTLAFRVDMSTTPGAPEPMGNEIGLAWTCAAGGKCHYAVRSFRIGSDDGIEAFARTLAGDVTVGADGAVLIQPTVMGHLSPDPVLLLGYAIARFPATPVGAGASWHLGERTWSIVSVSPLVVRMTERDGAATVVGTLHVDPADPVARTMDLTTDADTDLGGGERLHVHASVTLR